MSRKVYFSSKAGLSSTVHIACELAGRTTPMLLIDASHTGELTNHLFDYDIPKDIAQGSFGQLLADLIESNGSCRELDLRKYMKPIPNPYKSPEAFVIPSMGDLNLYLGGLYTLKEKPQRYPRAIPIHQELLTSLSTLLDKLNFQGQVIIETSPTLDIVTQMAIVAAK